MSRCKCADTHRPPSWYPARLISLEELKTQDFLDTRRLVSTSQRDSEAIDQTMVRVVETESWRDGRPGHGDCRYVTCMYITLASRYCPNANSEVRFPGYTLLLLPHHASSHVVLHSGDILPNSGLFKHLLILYPQFQSHCWGSDVHKQLRLNSSNLDEFKKGIRLNTLPRTFRDAIEFAARLPRVGYIWIDSLCIKQGPEEGEDWLKQSATMDRVYSEGFLNISATAATNSDGGLFFHRRPELLLEDEIILNIEGIPGVANRRPTAEVETEPTPTPTPTTRPALEWLEAYWLASYLLLLLRHFHTMLGRYIGVKAQDEHTHLKIHSRANSKGSGDLVSSRDSNPSGESDTDDHSSDTDRKNLRRCTILDVSFWTNHVEKAPVNTRGWVLQERILAPRVLHFCHDQVAWECAEFDAAEGQPQGMPNFQLTSNGIVEESRLKGLDPETDGKRLRRIRLQGFEDPDVHLQPEIHALELWRRIAEVYSRTAVTNSVDKLIALSGMARWMARRIGTPSKPAQYVAGLWNIHLASQLLWKIEPVFREIDSVFEHLSTAPEIYRAPSFSWASVDAQKGHGITYAEVTDRDLLIEVEEVSITPKSDANEYGMVSSGHIIILGKLRKATLFSRSNGRFGWALVDREDLDAEEHTNVYLDCPARDEDLVLGPDAGVYVVPAAMGDRTAYEGSKYMTCLLLQLIKGHEDGPAYRRIGITKLSPWAANKALHPEHGILEVYGSDVDMPHQGYDGATGTHRILVV